MTCLREKYENREKLDRFRRCEERDALAENCVTEVVEKSGETILLSSARNAYIINRVKRMVKRSVWALQNQLKQGEFYPALTE